MQFLVSAGEASGDMYAAGVVRRIKETNPSVSFFGCAGPKLQALGVHPVIDSADLAVVGLAEVIGHLPRLYAEYRKLIQFIRRNPPDIALLADSPDFNLRLARHLKKMGIPTFYLVAPQVWAWRQWRVRTIRARVDKLFCLFPFEERWFQERGVNATYIGHPLAKIVRSQTTRHEFCAIHRLDPERPIVTLCPGSREGEAKRHLPALLEVVKRLQSRFRPSTLLAIPEGFVTTAAFSNFREPIRALSIQIVENETWDCLAHADLALLASGTVTMEAAVLGTPMVTFYRVNPITWHAGRRLVKVPYFSMVNLIAGRKIVPELIQNEMTSERIAEEAEALLASPAKAELMRLALADVRRALHTDHDPLEHAADRIMQLTESGLTPQLV